MQWHSKRPAQVRNVQKKLNDNVKVNKCPGETGWIMYHDIAEKQKTLLHLAKNYS